MSEEMESKVAENNLKQVSKSTRIKELALKNLFLTCACVAVLAVILIFVFTFWKATPVITDIGLGEFFSLTWAPTEGHYGILALLAGSGIVTVGSLAIGVPLAVGCAVFLTEIAGKRLANVVSTAVDLLAGVPSVVYGFFGLVILRPFVANLTGGLGFGALTVWLVLAIMIVPTITTLTMDALRSIPMGIREASFAMGATRWQTIYRVVLRSALPSLGTAVILGLTRAFGEALAVQMVIGNAALMPTSLFTPAATLTSVLTMGMGNTVSGTVENDALWTLAMLLMIMSLVFIAIIHLIGHKSTVKA